MTGTYAILMGDLVGSESTDSVERLHGEFNDVVQRHNEAFKQTIASPLTITLGDEFQGLVHSLADACPLMRDLRLELLSRSIDCRFALGLAELRTALNPTHAWNMMGPGLAETRGKLNQKSDARYRFSIPQQPRLERLLEALGAGLAAIERRWTKQQLHDIKALIQGATASEIAKRRNVSVHSVYKVRNSGEYDTYLLQWHALAEALQSIDEKEKRDAEAEVE